MGQRFWVHASQRRLTRANFDRRYPKSIDDFVYGAIVGSAGIEDVVRGPKSFWAVRGKHHWVLGPAWPCTPNRRLGQLGFFKVTGRR